MDLVRLFDTTAPPPDSTLLAACTNGDFSYVHHLLSAQESTPSGCSELLGVAAENGHSDIVQFLLANYEKQQLVVHEGHALKATYSRGLECYRLIYEREPAVIHAQFNYQGSALLQAVARSNTNLLNYLLERGADPGRTVTDDTPTWFHRWIPIETAALRAPIEITQILLRHGASLEGTAALDLAAGNGHRMQLDVVRCLVEAGAALNATGMESRLKHGTGDWGPPLQSAIHAQRVEIVQYLLDQGASPLVYNVNGEDAFYKAWEVGNPEISQLLRAWRKAQQS
ncbi:MAG: hypothetical protein Q9220_003887 [cf. Caloplaca sp. 1 TL-2023]